MLLMLTELEKKIIASIQGDMAVTQRPYLNIAQDLEISEAELLANLKNYLYFCHTTALC